MKQLIRLTESDLHNLVKEAVKKVLKEHNELYDEWYQEEDYDGHQGQPGLIRSYDIGTVYDANVESDAKEMGFNNISDYLRYWFDEVRGETPWYWTQKSGRL